MGISSIILFLRRNIPLLLSVVLCAGGRVQCPVQRTLLCIEICQVQGGRRAGAGDRQNILFHQLQHGDVCKCWYCGLRGRHHR